MDGTLAAAVAWRKFAFDRCTFTATWDGLIAGAGRALRIEWIVVHYDLTVPAAARESAERALAAHPLGCPAHESVKDAITIRWDATLRAGGEVVRLSGAAVPG